MSLDDIVENVLEEAHIGYFVMVTDKNKSDYVTMLKSEMRKKRAKKFNPEKKNDAFFRYLVDRTVVFAYLKRELKLFIDNAYELVDSDERLRYMHVYSCDGFWSDRDLGKLSRRRERGHKKHDLPNYVGIINELGTLKFIKDIWGRRITYEQDVIMRRVPQGRQKRTKSKIGPHARWVSTHRR